MPAPKEFEYPTEVGPIPFRLSYTDSGLLDTIEANLWMGDHWEWTPITVLRGPMGGEIVRVDGYEIPVRVLRELAGDTIP